MRPCLRLLLCYDCLSQVSQVYSIKSLKCALPLYMSVLCTIIVYLLLHIAGQSGIQYQELTSQQPGRPSAQLQAAVAYAGTWQRGGRTVLCLAVPLAAVAPPRQGSRRRMLQSDQPLRWLPPDVYLGKHSGHMCAMSDPRQLYMKACEQYFYLDQLQVGCHEAFIE